MNIRTLRAAALNAGWKHTLYTGSFGVEHVWRRDRIKVMFVRWSYSIGDVGWRMTVTDGFREIAPTPARVYSADDALHLLHLCGITVPAVAPVPVATNPDRRCRHCGATQGLVLIPHLFAEHEWKCRGGCKDGGAR